MKTRESLDPTTLWQTHHDALLAFIQSRVADHAIAADILQEVFIKIIDKLDVLREQEKVRSWLYQITRNAIIDYFRKEKVRTRIGEEWGKDEDWEDDTAMQHMESCIRPMIDSLPTKYREALILSEIEGLSQKELAAQLGISYSGAKSRVQRGRLLLKQTLTDCCTFELDRYGKILDYRPNPQPPCAENC